MPLIEIVTDSDLSVEQKQAFIAEVSHVLEHTIQASIERTRIIFYEVTPEQTREGLASRTPNDGGTQD